MRLLCIEDTAEMRDLYDISMWVMHMYMKHRDDTDLTESEIAALREARLRLRRARDGS
jgi:hypothetical protein